MIRVRRAWPGDADAVREVGLKTWPVANEGLASPDDELMWMSLDLQSP